LAVVTPLLKARGGYIDIDDTSQKVYNFYIKKTGGEGLRIHDYHTTAGKSGKV
jgi:hypothetical protein